ncbi:MAG: hypothetical protein Q8R36_02480 [bacterium]|nr:hypothetical protein [bacterium]
MSYVLSPKGFLQVGGAVLLLVAVLGFVGVIGPSADSLFGSFWYFDGAENIAHFVLGVVALGLAFWASSEIQKWITVVVGGVAVVAALWSLFGVIPDGSNLLGAQLQNPADTVLHAIVGAWALFAGLKGGNGGI